MIDRDEARDERLNARSRERTDATIASKETCSIESIDRWDRSAWCSRERTITTLTGDEDRQRMQKGTQQSTSLWLLSCFFSLRWSAWIPALTTNKRVHRVWTNSTINQIGFLYNPKCLSLYTATLWTERCLTTESRQYTCDGCHQGTLLLLL